MNSTDKMQRYALWVSLLILVAFFAFCALVLLGPIQPDRKELVNQILPALIPLATSAAGFWLGSSSSSRQKDAALAASVPVSTLLPTHVVNPSALPVNPAPAPAPDHPAGS